MSQNASIAFERYPADNPNAANVEPLIESRGFRRWVGGCVGYVHHTPDKRFVGGCAGWIHNA